MKTEEAKGLIDEQLESLSNALESGQSDALQRFFATMARFHRYSLGNLLLIMAQRPDATNVAGFATWKSLDRFVRSGEKGIAILAPMTFKNREDQNTQAQLDTASFRTTEDRAPSEGQEAERIGFRVVHVFDVSQTDGEPLPDIGKVTGDPGNYTERLKGLVQQLMIELQYQDDLGGAMGVSKGGRICIQSGLDPAQEFQVLAHELAHEILHKGDRRAETSKTVRELEAEAVAFVISQAVGLDAGTASADYIQLYKGNKELLTGSLNMIRQAAGTILEQLFSPTIKRDPEPQLGR